MRPRRPSIEELEPRILYSADFAPQLFDQAAAPAVEQRMLDGADEYAWSSDELGQLRRHEIVFVDPGTPDYATLIQGLRRQDGGESIREWVVLDADRDGVTQIAQALSVRHDVSAVHIVSHGSDGSLRLGNGQLDFDALLAHAGAVKGWGRALVPGADLLIYGCDVAASEAGRSLLQALARLTGADVSASDDRTASAERGGDWDLEFMTGRIETDVVIDANVRDTWRGSLGGPLIVVPGAQSVAEDNVLAIAGLSVSDVDGDLSSVSLAVSNGTLNIVLGGGAVISAGTNGGAGLTLSGNDAQINAALATLNYRASADFNGGDALAISALDATGLTDADAVNITVNAQNDAPVITLPATAATGVDQQIVFRPGDIAIIDVDAGAGLIEVSITATDGTSSLGGMPGLTFLVGDGRDDASMTFRGTLARVNAAINNMQFRPDPGFIGVATLTLATSDLGNVGAGGTLTDSGIVRITVGGPGSVPPINEQDSTDEQLAVLAQQQLAAHASTLPQHSEGATLRFVGAVALVSASPASTTAAISTETSAELASTTTDAGIAALPDSAQLVQDLAAMGKSRASWTARISAQLVQTALAGRVDGSSTAAAMDVFADLWQDLSAPLLTPVAGLVSGPPAGGPPTGDPSQDSVEELVEELTYLMGFALSVGAVLWANRAGLLTGLLLSMPAWRGVDPLPVLAANDGNARADSSDREAAEAAAEGMVFQMGRDLPHHA